MPQKFACISKECVACGTCVLQCPRKAISVHKGKFAVVNKDRCIGCGKCAAACPAGVISITRREGERGA